MCVSLCVSAAVVFSADYLAVCQASWDLSLEGKKIQLLKKSNQFICCNLVLIHYVALFCFSGVCL